MIHIKSLSDFKKMPWKNGLGLTSEISIFPENAEISKLDFDWRLSIAYVQQNSEFSLYPKYQRRLTVLKGEGLFLKKNRPEELKKMEQIGFSGNEKIYAELIESKPVMDLGIIYNSEKIDCEFRFFNDCKIDLDLKKGRHFCVGMLGSFSANGLKIDEDEIAQIENESVVKLQANLKNSQLVLVSIYTK